MKLKKLQYFFSVFPKNPLWTLPSQSIKYSKVNIDRTGKPILLQLPSRDPSNSTKPRSRSPWELFPEHSIRILIKILEIRLESSNRKKVLPIPNGLGKGGGKEIYGIIWGGVQKCPWKIVNFFTKLEAQKIPKIPSKNSNHNLWTIQTIFKFQFKKAVH